MDSYPFVCARCKNIRMRGRDGVCYECWDILTLSTSSSSREPFGTLGGMGLGGVSLGGLGLGSLSGLGGLGGMGLGHWGEMEMMRTMGGMSASDLERERREERERERLGWGERGSLWEDERSLLGGGESERGGGGGGGGNHCRGMCGFCGTTEQLMYCSSCFQNVKDNPFLKAVVAASQDKDYWVLQYFENGGELYRTLTDEEARTLRSKMCLPFAEERMSLFDIANRYSAHTVLCILLDFKERDDHEDARRPLSSLLDDTPAHPAPMSREEIDRIAVTILMSRSNREDGLAYFETFYRSFYRLNAASADDLESGRVSKFVGMSFALPMLSQGKSIWEKSHPLYFFGEQKGRKNEVSEGITFIGTVPECCELVPLHTPADLNCLLHGLFLGICALRDEVVDPVSLSRTILRDALFSNLNTCVPLLQHIATTPERLEELLKDASEGKRSLDGGHIFAFANILRRPIIVYAATSVEGEVRNSVSVPFRVSGVYLPLLWEPQFVAPDPLMLCYTNGHFSCLVGFVDLDHTDRVTVPLCDEQYTSLPVHFGNAVFPSLTSSVLLSRYLRNYRIVTLQYLNPPQEVGVCDQLHPCDSDLDMSSSDAIFAHYRKNLFSKIEDRVAVALSEGTHE